MAAWSPLVYGNMEYLLCYAAAGFQFQLYAVTKNLEAVSVSECFDMSTCVPRGDHPGQRASHLLPTIQPVLLFSGCFNVALALSPRKAETPRFPLEQAEGQGGSPTGSCEGLLILPLRQGGAADERAAVWRTGGARSACRREQVVSIVDLSSGTVFSSNGPSSTVNSQGFFLIVRYLAMLTLIFCPRATLSQVREDLTGGWRREISITPGLLVKKTIAPWSAFLSGSGADVRFNDLKLMYAAVEGLPGIVQAVSPPKLSSKGAQVAVRGHRGHCLVAKPGQN